MDSVQMSVLNSAVSESPTSHHQWANAMVSAISNGRSLSRKPPRTPLHKLREPPPSPPYHYSRRSYQSVSRRAGHLSAGERGYSRTNQAGERSARSRHPSPQSSRGLFPYMISILQEPGKRKRLQQLTNNSAEDGTTDDTSTSSGDHGTGAVALLLLLLLLDITVVLLLMLAVRTLLAVATAIASRGSGVAVLVVELAARTPRCLHAEARLLPLAAAGGGLGVVRAITVGIPVRVPTGRQQRRVKAGRRGCGRRTIAVRRRRLVVLLRRLTVSRLAVALLRRRGLVVLRWRLSVRLAVLRLAVALLRRRRRLVMLGRGLAVAALIVVAAGGFCCGES